VSRLRLIAVATVLALGIAAGLVSARYVGGAVVLVYVLAYGALLLVLLLSGLRSRLPLAVRFERLLAPVEVDSQEVEQFRTLERDLRLSVSFDHDLYFHLRPRVREIVAVRLAKRHGVDLEGEPEQAQSLIGPGRVWELVRPDREAPVDRHARGWSRIELEQLVDELERL